MRVQDLLEAPSRGRKPRSGRGSTTHNIEMSSEQDDVKIEVEYEFNVEPPEYEDGFKSMDGAVELEDAQITPFTFEKKRYTEITPEIVGYLEFPTKFEKLHKALIDRAQDDEKKKPLTKQETDKLVKEYLNFVFDNYVNVFDIE